MENRDCIREVKEMCKEEWKAGEVARGEYWMEIEWERKESENRFMIIYGKENIDTISHMLLKPAN